MPEIIAFRDERFPTDIAFGSTGGPQRNTEIITLGSGREQRNQRWAHSHRKYDAGYGVKDIAALEKVIDLFEACRGPLIGFRFRDVLDFKSCSIALPVTATDQVIGVGDGQTTRFQMIKTYGSGADAYQRLIKKPVSETVRVAVNGVEIIAPSTWSLDADHGYIEFASAAVPEQNATISAGYEFDVPVRFDTDTLDVNLAAFNAGTIPSIPLVEIV